MNAVVILAVAFVLSWLWYKFLDDASGEELMGCGIFALLPFAVICVGAVGALLIFT